MGAGGFKKLKDVLEDGRNRRPQREPSTRKPGSNTPPATVRGIPATRLGDTFENFDLSRNAQTERALKRCRAVAAGEAWSAFLAGPPGTGKTHLAIAALIARWPEAEDEPPGGRCPTCDGAEFVRAPAQAGTGQDDSVAHHHPEFGKALPCPNARYHRRLSGYFWKVPDFLDRLRHELSDEAGSLELILRTTRERGDLLVFDDLGTENPTDWAHEQIHRVLDSRYDLKLPTIITTNQPLDRIDGRLLSRFQEGLVVCEGRDVRRTEEGRER